MSQSLKTELKKLFAPRNLPNPDEWIYKNCRLSPNISPENPGKLRVFPYAREIVNSFRDIDVKKITLCWGSQASKTTTIYGGLAYLLAELPQDTMYIMPSAENARRFSKGRWMPFVEECQKLIDICPKSASSGKIDTDKITNMVQEFLPCTLTFTGAGSENNVKSSPVSYLVLDEIDEIDPEIQAAAKERVKGRTDYKIIQTSTPSVDTKGIWMEFLDGDQRYYNVPCPHCGELIKLEWRQRDKDQKLRYSIGFDESAKQDNGQFDYDKVLKTAHYRCPHCDGKIYDGHKSEMLKNGVWIPENPLAPEDHKSYHLNSLYAPPITFGGMMVNWLQAQGSFARIKKFVQGNLAETFTDDWINSERADAKELEGEYSRGELKGQTRIISVDTQRDYFRYIVRGFDHQKDESYLIDFGSALEFSELSKLFDKYACQLGIIDSGGQRTQEVYDFVFQFRRKWFAAKGRDKMEQLYTCHLRDPFVGDTKGRAGKAKIRFFTVNKEAWESEILAYRNRKKIGFYVFENTPKEYYDELFSVFWKPKTDISGHIKLERKVKKCGDHSWDCECQAYALSRFAGISRSDTQPPSNQPRKQKKRKAKNNSSTGGWF